MALAFGTVEVVAGLMPTYAGFAAVLPVLGLACLLTLTAANAYPGFVRRVAPPCW